MRVQAVKSRCFPGVNLPQMSRKLIHSPSLKQLVWREWALSTGFLDLNFFTEGLGQETSLFWLLTTRSQPELFRAGMSPPNSTYCFGPVWLEGSLPVSSCHLLLVHFTALVITLHVILRRDLLFCVEWRFYNVFMPYIIAQLQQGTGNQFREGALCWLCWCNEGRVVAGQCVGHW